MPKCANCGHDNPSGKIFCEVCGHKVNRVEIPPEPTPEDLQVLQERVQTLQRDLLMREDEIKRLDQRLEEVTGERDKLVGVHPEVESILKQLDAKEVALQKALQELEDLRGRVPVTAPESLDSKLHFVIESHPIPNPAFDMTFDDNLNLLDLSATGFRIRANLERNADGSVGLVIHPGATVNIKAAGEKKWRRLGGGERLNTEAGMVLFDRMGVMNARLDRCS
jgi:uncharacterized Zn finger protein (UPF0148 family)